MLRLNSVEFKLQLKEMLTKSDKSEPVYFTLKKINEKVQEKDESHNVTRLEKLILARAKNNKKRISTIIRPNETKQFACSDIFKHVQKEYQKN